MGTGIGETTRQWPLDKDAVRAASLRHTRGVDHDEWGWPSN
jgi:hypothetical protein